jgi:hypothetical protein
MDFVGRQHSDQLIWRAEWAIFIKSDEYGFFVDTDR